MISELCHGIQSLLNNIGSVLRSHLPIPADLVESAEHGS